MRAAADYFKRFGPNLTSGYRAHGEWELRQQLREHQYRRRRLPVPLPASSHCGPYAVSPAYIEHGGAAPWLTRYDVPPVDCPYSADLWAMGRAIAGCRWHWPYPAPRAGARPYDQVADG